MPRGPMHKEEANRSQLPIRGGAQARPEVLRRKGKTLFGSHLLELVPASLRSQYPQPEDL